MAHFQYSGQSTVEHLQAKSEGESQSSRSRRVYRRETTEVPLPLPLAIEQFEVVRTIGTGAYSRVLLARHKASNQPIALKSMLKSDVLRSNQVDRVKYEKSILRLMKSPFVVGFRGTMQDEQHLYLALEYVCGGELFKVMIDNDRLTETQCQFYAAELTYSLCDLHAINCIYRDLKPENVVLTCSGHIKLVDFGCAKIITFENRTFTLCGTPEYLSPEVIEKNGHSVASDWWQLGVLLFEMMAAYPPFCDQSPYRLYEKILLSNVQCPKFFSPVVVSFLEGLLRKNPRERLQGEEVKRHQFFANLSWEAVKNRDLTPPFIPPVRDPFDSSNFNSFEEEQEIEPTDPTLDHIFSDF